MLSLNNPKQSLQVQFERNLTNLFREDKFKMLILGPKNAPFMTRIFQKMDIVTCISLSNSCISLRANPEKTCYRRMDGQYKVPRTLRGFKRVKKKRKQIC